MKYDKKVISGLVLLSLFSGSCLIATYNINNTNKTYTKSAYSQQIKQGLTKRLLDNTQQSLLSYNSTVKSAFNNSFGFMPREHLDNFSENLSKFFEQENQAMYELNSKAITSTNFMIENTDKTFKVSAIMQNVTKEMLKISVYKGFLEVKADKKLVEDSTKDKTASKDDKKAVKEKAFATEYSSFKKLVKLPKNIDATKAQISFKDNILVVTFPKTELKEEKPIELKIK
jgi:HSP20 family molecular chaperone IbpA